jgi:hypothetical protein
MILMNLEKEEMLKELKIQKEVKRAQKQMLNPFFESGVLIEKMKKMCGKLDDECTLLFKQRLNVIQRKFLVSNITNS